MQYVLLIYGSEEADPNPQTEEEMEAYMKPWFDYNELLKSQDAMLGGEALQPVETATTVTNHGGEPVFTDGPFAETKEQLGGFYLVEAKDLDHALTLAAQCPGAKTGRIEVRPVMEIPGDD